MKIALNWLNDFIDLNEIKVPNSDGARGQLASFFKGQKLGTLKKFVLKRLGMQKITHHDFVNYDFKNLPNRFTKKLNVPLLTWTVKSQKDFIKAIKHADNIVFQDFIPKI